MIIDYIVSIDYTDDEAPILSEDDIKVAITEALEETGIDADALRVGRED